MCEKGAVYIDEYLKDEIAHERSVGRFKIRQSQGQASGKASYLTSYLINSVLSLLESSLKMVVL